MSENSKHTINVEPVPQREEIESRLLAGESISHLSQAYKVSRPTLYRWQRALEKEGKVCDRQSNRLKTKGNTKHGGYSTGTPEQHKQPHDQGSVTEDLDSSIAPQGGFGGGGAHTDHVPLEKYVTPNNKKNSGRSRKGVTRQFEMRVLEQLPPPMDEERVAEFTEVNLMERLSGLADRASAIQEDSRDRDRPQVELLALKEEARILSGVLELAARVNEKRDMDIRTRRDWIAVRDIVIQALTPFPEAKRAVVEALKGVAM